MGISRRKFIQISAAGGGAAALGTGLMTNMWGLTPDEVSDPKTDGDKVVATFCEMCFWKCGVLAHVKDGRVTKIVGNPEHPLSKGRLCPRGTGGVGLLYDPDRLQRPLVRKEARGEQVFEEVEWDEALDLVATKLQGVIDQHGPEALALFAHGCGGSWFTHLFKALGSANHAGPSYAQCRGARESAFELTFGAPVGSPEVTDIENTRVLTLIGAHLGENMHNTQVQELAKAIEAGAELVVVDPRFSTAAGKAKYWLPIKPGTDTALLLAWMHVIVKEKLYDQDYLERYAVGFEQLAAHLEDKTPEWAFVQTTIPVDTIVETARFIASRRPTSLVHPGRRTSWYGDDTQRARAVAVLNALLGNWGRAGGFYIPTKFKIPKADTPAYTLTPKTPPDMPKGTVYPFAGEVLADGLRNASLPSEPNDYPIKAWMVYGTNLNQALPDKKRTLEALQNLDFMVAIDVLPAEICGWADVVLPENTYLERYDDLQTPGFRTPFLSLRQPVVDSLYESKPGWWIAQQLAERMGVGEYFPFDDVESYLAERLEKAGVSFEKLKKHGVINGKPEAINLDEGLELTFDTPSGKIELFSQRMADAGLPPLPTFTAPDEPGPNEFRLLFGRTPTHTFGRTTNNRFLSEIYDENVLWLNAKVAKELGLENGEQVVMTNQDGVVSLPIKLKATQRIRHDCAFMVHGYGHTAPKLAFAFERGSCDTDMVTKTKIDPAMGGTGLNVNFVRVERWQA
ncbi:MAG: nitrate reductase [Deltaproteobacteria bacterium CG_4_9_14_3_um_filter_63_12]|nr:MAG: nitrate reductase [Deltaproteobacteria bacterium CG_4_9_14_3_um_filter_63_12]